MKSPVRTARYGCRSFTARTYYSSLVCFMKLPTWISVSCTRHQPFNLGKNLRSVKGFDRLTMLFANGCHRRDHPASDNATDPNLKC